MVSSVESAGLLYAGTAVAMLYFLRSAVHNRETPGSSGFAVMVLGSILWALAVGSSTFLQSLGPSLFLFNVQMLAAQVAMVGWFLLALEFLDADRPTRPVLVGLGGYLVVGQAVLWTNRFHRYLWSDARVLRTFVDLKFGIGWWPFVGSMYGLLLVSLGVFAWTFVRASGAKRMQGGAFALAMVPIIATSLATIFDWPFGRFDTTPFGYLVAFPVIAWALYRAQFLGVVPVARRTVVENMSDAIVTLDAEDHVVDYNAAAADLLDLESDAIGKPGMEIFDAYRSTARKFADVERGETEITIRDGDERRHFHLRISPLGEGTTTAGGRVVVLREITALKRREQELKSRERELDLLRQILSRVLRHNLRNELQVIRGTAKLIPELEGDQVERHVDIIVESVDDLMETSMKARQFEELVDNDRDPYARDVTDLVKRVVDDVRSEHPEATVETSLPAEAVARTSDNFPTAVRNLVENAVVHNDDDPTVEVSVDVEDDSVVVRVADDGPGIPEDELAVLDARSESALQHGSGSGLWLATWIVERSDGGLSFDTGDGTTATIRLERGEAILDDRQRESDDPVDPGRPEQS